MGATFHEFSWYCGSCVAPSWCHVEFSDRRFDHFSKPKTSRPFAGQHAHYYYLKGLLFCFWLILQPPGDRNHDVGLGQAWLVACLMAEELLHFTCAAQPNFLYYSSVIAFSIRQQISFKNDPMLVLLLDFSRKINHLCNLFYDLIAKEIQQLTHIYWSIFGAKWKHI